MTLSAIAFATLAVAPAIAQEHAGHTMPVPQTAPGQRNPNLPPDADAAKEQLAKSSRHGDWVDIKMANGPAIKSFVVYPERSTKAPVVIVIHEIFGMADWVRGVTDQLAKEGFIAIAPDLLSGKGPNGGGTESLGDQVGQTIRTLTPADLSARLDAVMAYGKGLPASSGKTATIGVLLGRLGELQLRGRAERQRRRERESDRAGVAEDRRVLANVYGREVGGRVAR
jgi:carboxymethylenebutenolidase